MQLGITLKLAGATPQPDMDSVLEAERLGFSQVWTGESYSTDAISPVAWVLARTTKIKAGTGIMQIPARTPCALPISRRWWRAGTACASASR
jgi:alkanesulfonate monooxygenase SsuD/methylene tetrahydromethanopterin reductase-like flavin-dependent oxidoreductase (luciferase family)